MLDDSKIKNECQKKGPCNLKNKKLLISGKRNIQRVKYKKVAKKNRWQ